jgi:hypothetical protein
VVIILKDQQGLVSCFKLPKSTILIPGGQQDLGEGGVCINEKHLKMVLQVLREH